MVLAFIPFLFIDSALIENIPSAFLIGFGLSQSIYMGPAIYYAFKRGRPDIAKGLIIGAAVTFLLNGACWGLLGVALIGADFR